MLLCVIIYSDCTSGNFEVLFAGLTWSNTERNVYFLTGVLKETHAVSDLQMLEEDRHVVLALMERDFPVST